MSKCEIDGRDEMWEAIKRIVLPGGQGGYSCVEMGRIFGDDWTDNLFKMTATEALEAIRRHEEIEMLERDR